MNCPVCGGRATGKVGASHYYCWDCCVEYRIDKEGIQVFDIDEEGSLVSFDPGNEALY